jgi:Glycosyl transferase family 2
MHVSAAAEVAPGLERWTVPQPTTDGQGTAVAMPTGTALTLVFPCYNEAERLPQTLAAYLGELPRQPGAVEVLVVDDGSTDQTFAVAQAIAAQDDRVRIIRSQPNHGKGFGVRTGMLHARGELLVFTDADGSYGPGEVARVTAALAHAPVAIGSRPAGWAAGPPARRLASRLFNRAIQALLRLPYRDTQCGLRAFAATRRLSCSGAHNWTASPSTSNCCSWPAASAWRSRRSPSGPRCAMAARSSSRSTPWACCATCCGCDGGR